MQNHDSLPRRAFLLLMGSAVPLSADVKWPEAMRLRIAAYLERHKRPEGGYGWVSDVTAQVTPTFGVVGSYHALGMAAPDAGRTAAFVRDRYPVPELRRKERPLWRLDFEQAQTLLWLGEPIESFRALASTWIKPADFTKTYELNGNPVFQHQAMAVRVRHLLKLESTEAWREYFLARRRPNGTFNNTPASDGSGGHVMNTLWGMLACEALGVDAGGTTDLAAWVRACQLPSGGFTYAPKATLGAVDDLAYTWCALQILKRLGAEPVERERCGGWIESLFTREGGFQDRPGGEPNPLATYYALESLLLLERTPKEASKPAARARWAAIPPGAKIFTIQVQAPGTGSPREAVLMAKTLGIDIWTAKNSPQGWIEEARKAAAAARVAVRFEVGNEEYGTFVNLPGLGCYSHLVDLMAPYDADWGAQLPKKTFPYPWPEFRDTRMAALRKGGGRMVWQFNENEELTRILLDEAVQKGTYAAIASFHFGNENFLHSQPVLHRWYGRLPYIGLQDAHGGESWWWGDQLSGFRTLYAAKDASWKSWLAALDAGLVMSVRHDVVSGWKTHLAGGSPALRDFVNKHEAEWRWWDDAGRQVRRPVAAMTVLKPGMKFETGVPAEGYALRLRLWADNNGQALPKIQRTELISLLVDGKRMEPALTETKTDRYYLVPASAAAGRHSATAQVRVIETGRVVSVVESWDGD
jgi:hypothetical protein